MILDESHFYQVNLTQALQTDFVANVDTCLVLLVLGLGSVATYHHGHTEWAPDTNDGSKSVNVGMSFLNMAKEMFRQNWGHQLAQRAVLASYVVRPDDGPSCSDTCA